MNTKTKTITAISVNQSAAADIRCGEFLKIRTTEDTESTEHTEKKRVWLSI